MAFVLGTAQGFGYGWFDYVVPGGYVTGSGLTVTLDIEATNVAAVNVLGIQVNGGSLTSAPAGPDTNDGGTGPDTPVGTIACMAPGAVAVLFVNGAQWAPNQGVPIGRSLVPVTIPGSNVASTATVGAVTIGNTSAAPPQITGFPLWKTTGTGFVNIDTNGNFPLFLYQPAWWHEPIVDGGTNDSGLDDGMGHPYLNCAGPAAGTVEFSAGQTLTITVQTTQNPTPHAPTGTIHSVKVNAGAGGTQTIDPTTFQVLNWGVPGVTVHMGMPRAIDTRSFAPPPGPIANLFLKAVQFSGASQGQIF